MKVLLASFSMAPSPMLMAVRLVPMPLLMSLRLPPGRGPSPMGIGDAMPPPPLPPLDVVGAPGVPKYQSWYGPYIVGPGMYQPGAGASTASNLRMYSFSSPNAIAYGSHWSQMPFCASRSEYFSMSSK